MQKRAYDKGLEVARVVVVEANYPDGPWWWSRPLIEGTRMDARDVADLAAQHGVDEVLAQYPHLTPEQIDAAIVWRRAHPKWRPKTKGGG